MRRFSAILFLLVALTVRAVEIPSDVRNHFEGRILTPIEGVWLWNSGAMVSIDADSKGGIVLTLVDCPDPLVETPAVIGSGVYAGAADTYNIDLKTMSDAVSKKTKIRSVKYVAKLINNSRLSLTPYSTSIKISPWRLIPYMFRFSLSKEKAPSGIDGAIKIWPPLGSPEFPVVL